MKRNLGLLLLSFGLFISGFAQRKQNSSGSSSTYLSNDTAKKGDIREKLVQLAIQNPTYEVADRKVAIANQELSKTKNKILGQVVLSGNLNELSINPPKDGYNVYYPRYNIGATLPLDLFITRSKEINIAKENLGIAQAERNERYRLIKAEVLTAYEDYLMAKQKVEFQSQITQDAFQEYKQQERDFSDGIIEQKEYNAGFKKWTEEQSRKIEMQRNLNVIKLNIEAMIGMPFDELLSGYEKDKH
ncbi:TolC family protein [Pinibacter soli]|uniref:TolC family protein n=1 Tax=Pinibacter soli TaxID=3044211 RepID=A0ABT6R8F6_9BACT|nr:TolC family protein [Pinibacter soli]MDI3318197.1 TolC family protein [Pinibacter soli]